MATPSGSELRVSHRPTISFDGWVLRTDLGELAKDGRKIRLQDQPLQILEELLSQPGELVTREQLIARLWPKGVVDFDTGLNSAVRKLRVALQDEAETPRYIETVPRKGYRFIGAIDSPATEPAPIPPPQSVAERGTVGVRVHGLGQRIVRYGGTPIARSPVPAHVYICSGWRRSADSRRDSLSGFAANRRRTPRVVARQPNNRRAALSRRHSGRSQRSAGARCDRPGSQPAGDVQGCRGDR